MPALIQVWEKAVAGRCPHCQESVDHTHLPMMSLSQGLVGAGQPGLGFPVSRAPLLLVEETAEEAQFYESLFPWELPGHIWSTPWLIPTFFTAHSYGTAAASCVCMGTVASLFKIGKLEDWEFFATRKV